MHSYNGLFDLLIQLAMDKDNGLPMDKYVRKHLGRETPAEKIRGRRPSQPNHDQGKGRRGQVKLM